MNDKQKILIIEDEEIDRALLTKLLSDTYTVVAATNGLEAIEYLELRCDEITAIVSDIYMPVGDGFFFLAAYNREEKFKHIPVLVSTSEDSFQTEERCLKLGACDFIRKPYNGTIIKYRLANAIEKSKKYLASELRYREEYDKLTGIYSKDMFFKMTNNLLQNNKNDKFVFIRVDIEKFQLINSFFGIEEGDKLIKYLSEYIKVIALTDEKSVYGRIEADVFCLCTIASEKWKLINLFEFLKEKLDAYPLDYNITPVFGIYYIDDNNESISEIYNKANLATKQCKENMFNNYKFYTKDMSEKLINEQIIINEMERALEHEEFVLYYQPKYDITGESNVLCGSETLVRWKHPDKGLIMPGTFIPVFEKNGFITKMDYYVWEHACIQIRKWLDEGKKPLPVSVNVSRISFFNPKLVSVICDLVNKYKIPRDLFRLELTESAYTSNPEMIKEMVNQFRKNRFIVLMDDFGSGYSSLNVLKDIDIDILKMDMKFLDDNNTSGKSGKILASVVDMAKKLELKVVAEGVERIEQVEFLKSIRCDMIQGYYFSKPVPVEEYESIVNKHEAEVGSL